MAEPTIALTRQQQITRHEFAGDEARFQAETAIAAVTARERAIIEAEYVAAERHPRNWLNVRASMLDHCKRPRFAEVSRYAKPVGKKLVNGEWIEEKARGWSARFAETLAQEMGNVKPWSAVTFEDDAIRIVRFGVVDLQNNLPRSREVTFAKAVEKRGRLDKKTGIWSAPDGREVISHRINTREEPVYLVKATDDEMRVKINSEESKTQRDMILKLCPRDILEECEDQYHATMQAEDKRDPAAAIKKMLDRFQELGVLPSDLETYVGRPVKQLSPADIQELRELWTAIHDGQTTFNEALRKRYAQPAEGEEESEQQHDERIQRQMRQQAAQNPTQEEVAERKIAEAKARQQAEQQGSQELQPDDPDEVLPSGLPRNPKAATPDKPGVYIRGTVKVDGVALPVVDELPDPVGFQHFNKCVRTDGIVFKLNEDTSSWTRVGTTELAGPVKAGGSAPPQRKLSLGGKR